MTTIREFCASHADEMTRLRRDLHREPEIGLDLPKTQARILAELDGLPLEITTGTACTSVTAVLRGGRRSGDDAPVVLLRGDMDALPVDEDSGEDFASTNGAMHACGHDLHVAQLVWAAKALCERRDELAGDVVFMFQPGEEGDDGAAVMIKEGVLDAAGRRVDHAYGIHVAAAGHPSGEFGTRPGALMSAADHMTLRLVGRGGHGSMPHTAVDPVVAAAGVITALQVMVTRSFDIFDPVVISVGSVQAGQAANVIPESALLKVTLRSFSHAAQDRLFELVPRVVEGVAAAHGVEAEIDLRHLYPVTINDDAEAEYAEGVVRDLFGDDRYERWANPLTGSEDFSHVLDEVPGCYLFLSAVYPGTDPLGVPFNHSAKARFDDSVCPDGATLLAELAARKLESLAGQGA